MSIWMESIAIKELGPLGERTFPLGRFNLIYGHNETGKTFLVEFLLRSLFREASKWKLRGLIGQGQVRVRGLASELVDFTPETGHKLEDFWEESELGLPANMAQLLVVKGAELELAESRAGINRDVLKTVLSREVLLDQILGKIKKTVRDAEIEYGVIKAASRTLIKQRENVIERRNLLSKLLDRVERLYSQGTIRLLEIQKKDLHERIQAQRRAKRNEAYKLNARKEELHRVREKLPEEDIESLRDHLKDYRRIANQIGRRDDELEGISEAEGDYEWVSQAVSVWQSMRLEMAGAPSVSVLIGGITALVLGFLAGLFQYVIPAILLFAGGTALSGYYLWKLRTRAMEAGEAEEKEHIQSEFRNRFGKPLNNLATLQAEEKALHKKSVQAESLGDEIVNLRNELVEHEDEINRYFEALKGESVERGKWDEAAEMIKQRAGELDNAIQELDIRLGQLNVDESDFVVDEVDTQYSAERLEELEDRMGEIESELQKERNGLENLKQSLCDETGDDISEPWPVVLQNIRERMQETQEEYKTVTARILAQIGVVKVLDEIKKQEDEKIRRGLQDKVVLETLQRVTGIYDSIQLLDDQIRLSGSFGSYPMAEISTGAKEQVLLALRMGFSTRMTGGKPLFLILDDAFQYSDWDRRERLVEKAAELARTGWQITYLSMDNHLRDLFIQEGERSFGDEFRSYSIDN